MTGECTYCAIFGFIVLPFLILGLFTLPIALIRWEKSTTLKQKTPWLIASGLPLSVIFPVPFLLSKILHKPVDALWMGEWLASALVALSLAIAIYFRVRHWKN
jgi:hypothetical protein